MENIYWHIEINLFVSNNGELDFSILKKITKDNTKLYEYYYGIQSYDICKEIIKNYPEMILFTRKVYFTEDEYIELCEIAISKDIKVIKYIDNDIDEYRYLNLAMIFVKKYNRNKYNINDFINFNKFKKENYIGFYNHALNYNSYLIEYVKKDIVGSDNYLWMWMRSIDISYDANLQYLDKNDFTTEQYLFITTYICKKFGMGLKYVDGKSMKYDNYLSVCKYAIKKDGYAIEHVDTNIINKEDYTYLSYEAIKEIEFALQNIKYEHLPTKDDYFNICMRCICNDSGTIGCVKIDGLSIDKYLELLKESIKKNYNNFINIDKTNENYELFVETAYIIDRNITNYVDDIDLLIRKKMINIVDKDLPECPICDNMKEYYLCYSCDDKHIFCIDCKNNNSCYYRCKDSSIDMTCLYKNTNYIDDTIK